MWSVVYINAKWTYTYRTLACTIRECATVRNFLQVTLTCPFISWCSGATNVKQTPRVCLTLAAPEHQEMNGQVEVTWRKLRTVAHSLMVHARFLEVYVHFTLMYTTDHIFTVLPIKDLINEYGYPTTPQSCSSPRWDNLTTGHQRNPLLGLKVRYMYWGQKDFSEKIETCQYMQKKEVSVLMFFFSVYR